MMVNRVSASEGTMALGWRSWFGEIGWLGMEVTETEGIEGREIRKRRIRGRESENEQDIVLRLWRSGQ